MAECFGAMESGMVPYRLNMSDTMSTSISAAAIFSADVGCGRPPPKRKDIVTADGG